MNKDLDKKEYLGYLTEYNKDILTTISDSLSNDDKNRFWEYRRKWDAAENCNTDFEFPVNLDFDLVDACNLTCSHCVRKQKGVRVADGSIRLGLENFKRLIDEGKEYGLTSISLGNSGEGLLEKKIVQMVEYARKSNVLDIWLSTNGLLLSPDLTKELIQSGLTRISISIDAFTEEIYSKVRGGDLKVLTDNIDFLLNERDRQGIKLPILRVTSINLDANRNEIPEFLKHWNGKADSVGIQEYIDFDEERNLTKEDIMPFSCPSPWRNLLIGTNGDVTPCCTFFGKKIILGNTNTTSIKKIWDSNKTKALRNSLLMHKYPQPCIDCLGVPKKKDGQNE